MKQIKLNLFILILGIFLNCVTEEVTQTPDIDEVENDVDAAECAAQFACKKNNGSFVDKLWDNIKNTIPNDDDLND